MNVDPTASNLDRLKILATKNNLSKKRCGKSTSISGTSNLTIVPDWSILGCNDLFMTLKLILWIVKVNFKVSEKVKCQYINMLAVVVTVLESEDHTSFSKNKLAIKDLKNE